MQKESVAIAPSTFCAGQFSIMQKKREKIIRWNGHQA
jgi:hypothetical protein